MFNGAKPQEVKVLSGIGEDRLSEKAIDWYMENGIPLSIIRGYGWGRDKTKEEANKKAI